jgi:hypothetical protein
MKILNGHTDLLEVVAAGDPTARFPRRLNGRQEQANEQTDDGDYHQELYKCEGGSTARCDKKFHGTHEKPPEATVDQRQPPSFT